jgi:hypothetical protein
VPSWRRDELFAHVFYKRAIQDDGTVSAAVRAGGGPARDGKMLQEFQPFCASSMTATNLVTHQMVNRQISLARGNECRKRPRPRCRRWADFHAGQGACCGWACRLRRA